MKKLIVHIRQNGLLALLALFLSWMSWVMISASVTETKEMEVTVKIIAAEGVDPDLILLHGHRPKKVVVTISGSRRDMDRLDAANLRATFSVRAEFLDQSGELQSRTFTADDMELPTGIEVIEMRPARVVAEFAERRRASVEILVKTDTTKIPTDAGYELLRSIAIPAKIEIEGPSKLIEEPESRGIATEKVQVQNHPPGEIETEIDVVIPLDLADLTKRGLRASVTEVTVRLEFAHVWRKEVRVPLEVHWIDPDPAKPNIVKITTGTLARVEKSADGRLSIPVTLQGPRVLLEGEELEKTRSRIRAYVRVDSPNLEDLAVTGGLRVYFEGVREGIHVEDIPLANLPPADLIPFK